MTALSFMGYVALILLGFGLLATVAGWVLLLVPAFRRHLGWGLATLLIPGASLAFAAMHWAEARRGFLLQVMGAVLLLVGALAANDHGSSSAKSVASNPATESASNSTESALKAKEAEVRTAEQDLATLQTKLNGDYEALKARRAALGTDAAVLAAFNKDAATYTAEKTDLSVKAGQLAQLRADVVRLTDQLFLEARERAKLDPNSAAGFAQRELLRAATPRPISVADGDVVMYTTRRCPACLAAKQYLSRRGVTYKEFDVETSGSARADFDKLGGRAVPLIIVKGRQMVGFNQAELEKLL